MDWLLNAELWVALLTLSTLEIVLGVDNLVFISIAVSKLAPKQRPRARRFGLALACITRVLLLLSLVYLARMAEPLFVFYGQDISLRDLILISGGVFLVVKGTMEIHDSVESDSEPTASGTALSSFGLVIAQIAIIDIVFSLDSVITAIGMVDNIPIMVAAIVLAVAVMIFAADPLGEFIDHHPTIKMLALAFLILVGVALVADGLELHIPRGYLYFAMAFSGAVESLNLLARRRYRRRHRTSHAAESVDSDKHEES
jgi:predicted tellurium resistance membrane protein TerC